jgi:hypothetical protein
VLGKADEAVVVAFRRCALLPLDDCPRAPQTTTPRLRRSSLRRCFERHDIDRLPEVEGELPRKALKPHPIGRFHIDPSLRIEGRAADRGGQALHADRHR